MDKEPIASGAPALNSISNIGEDYFLTQLVNNIWAGLWMTTEDCASLEYVSPLFTSAWGRNLEEINKGKFGDTIHPEDREPFLKIFDSAVQKREAYSCAFRIIRPDGEIRYIESRGFPLMSTNDRTFRMAGLTLDVTNERKMELELVLSQKLGSIGQLAAGMSHEISTPTQFVTDNLIFLADNLGNLLSFINNARGLLSTDPGSGVDTKQVESLKNSYNDEDIDYLLEEIPLAISGSLEGMEQIKSLAQAIKKFSHHSEEKTYLNLNDAIANTITISRNEWKGVALITTDLEDTLPEILCSASAINQVLLNLIVNSAQAIKEQFRGNESGSIKISTRLDDGQIYIAIKDNGAGISQEIQNKVFSEFFTTKVAGQGTGQGLAISRKIITIGHGGQLLLDSTPGQGSTFTIVLPVS